MYRNGFEFSRANRQSSPEDVLATLRRMKAILALADTLDTCQARIDQPRAVLAYMPSYFKGSCHITLDRAPRFKPYLYDEQLLNVSPRIPPAPRPLNA
jgi:hypothetical protein